MKWMKRLRLINWHYFYDETVEFGKQTLITGKNAAGKSTIIDALQVLFVADQRQIKFNAAAHDEAKRTMINYLRGKIGTDRQTFVRHGDFTTYIVAEFYDAHKREPFVVGAVIDVFGDQDFEPEYFILSGVRLEELEFVGPSGELLNREAFRRRYGGSGRNRAIFERNKSTYQRALLARMGQVHERFFRVFVKALSFQPIQDVRTFVYDHILDEQKLRLDLLKQNFEIYERYKQELAELERRRDKLLAVRERYQEYAKWRDIVLEQDYVIRRLKWERVREVLAGLEQELRRLDEKLEEAEGEIALAKAKQEEAREDAEAALQRWQTHEAERRKKELDAIIRERANSLAELRRRLSSAVDRLGRELELLGGLAGWSACDGWQWREGEREVLERVRESLAAVHGRLAREERVEGAVGAALAEAGERLADLYQRAVIAADRVAEQVREAEERIADLERVIRNLEQKKRPYPESVERLKAMLEARLGQRSPVWIFCEEMELKDEAWRDAVEGYLNTQRFDLLVEPRAFVEALSVYEWEKWAHRLEGVGLVDTDKERKYLGTAEPGSLAGELEAPHPVIRAHVEHLLGRVMKAADEQDLRRYRTAVTNTCMVYHNLVARQIPKRHYEVPYIGAKAIARQLEMRRRELEDLRARRERLAAARRELDRWAERLRDKPSLYAALAEQTALPAELDAVKGELEAAEREREALLASDLFGQVERLKREYEAWRQAEKEWGARYDQWVRRQAGLEADRRHIEEQAGRQRQAAQEAEAEFQAWRLEYGPEAENRALARWEDAVRQGLPLARKLENWENNRKGNETRRNQEWDALRELRRQYNMEYGFDGPVDSEDNGAYESLLHDIEHLNLPQYREKVEQSLRESEEEFKSHFVFKLREAIHLARREFDELNYALRHFPFSEDRYHFEVTPSERYKKFYDAVMDPLLLERGSLFDHLQEERVQALHELFETLVRGEAGDVEEFTDYRRYLDFDIVITSRDRRTRFSHVLREKSGGETQTPFYIAILASFYHLYRSGKTVRLVVFDEAFNKMDEQRIRSSLRLIKQMDLQLIAAVPDEKMQHMVSEVTTTLIVTKQDDRCFVDLIERGEEGAVVDPAAGVGAEEDVERELSSGRGNGGREEPVPLQETLF
ncbi:ATPase [Kyrpidia spormannii]|uniref:ATPase n=1 Tax=Kyrpidia spormannii TaxID=2055160 RepID=A0A2K8N9V5_9BACL|nr:SbcC/MukB-like Walker B domain-containing protein [Kyrpidia spormannii]ATY86083.1 ATPase [Kyrpidia spormannii]